MSAPRESPGPACGGKHSQPGARSFGGHEGELSTRHSQTTRKPRQAAKAPFLERVASRSTPAPARGPPRGAWPKAHAGHGPALGSPDPGGPRGKGRPQALTAQAAGQGTNVPGASLPASPADRQEVHGARTMVGRPGCHSQWAAARPAQTMLPGQTAGKAPWPMAGTSRENLGHGQTYWAGLPWPGPNPGPRCQGGPGPPDPDPGHPRPRPSKAPRMAGRLAWPPAFSGPAFFAKTSRYLAAPWPGQRRRPLPRTRPGGRPPGSWPLGAGHALSPPRQARGLPPRHWPAVLAFGGPAPRFPLAARTEASPRPWAAARFAQGLVAALLSLPAARDDHALARAGPTLRAGGARPLSPGPHFPHACPPVQAPGVPGQGVRRGIDPGSCQGSGFPGAPKAQGRPVQAPATSRCPERGRKNQAGEEAKGRLSRQILPPRPPARWPSGQCGARPPARPAPRQRSRPGDCLPAAFSRLGQDRKCPCPIRRSLALADRGLSGMCPREALPWPGPKPGHGDPGQAGRSGPQTASPPRGRRWAKRLAPWGTPIPKGPRARTPRASGPGWPGGR